MDHLRPGDFLQRQEIRVVTVPDGRLGLRESDATVKQVHACALWLDRLFFMTFMLFMVRWPLPSWPWRLAHIEAKTYMG
jgi:hypothetical protein